MLTAHSPSASLQAARQRGLQRHLISEIRRTRVVLDIGCGIRPQNYVLPDVHICVEPHREYADYVVRTLATRGDRNYVVINATWREALAWLTPLCVDSVFLIDVIEHIEKAEAKQLLDRTLQLARCQIVIITPYGFMPQHHDTATDIWGFKGAEWQEHRSGWDESDFDERWRLLVVPEYYKVDNQGRPLPKPNGLLVAIYDAAHGAEPRLSARMRCVDVVNALYQLALNAYRRLKVEIRFYCDK